jgi:hypothetical protein
MCGRVIAVLILAGQLGQSGWCYVPQGSEQLFCDYVSSCQSAHQHDKVVPAWRDRGSEHEYRSRCDHLY